MGQSNAIFAAIFIAYVIFITMRGEVGIYWGLLTQAPRASGAAPTGNISAQAQSGIIAPVGESTDNISQTMVF